jgi:PadR family transcriptional regulator, regulatory protein PadR
MGVTRHPQESDPLRGSIDLLILKALTLEPTHGWGIGLRIQQISNGRLDVNQGSLYPALQRLEHRGWVESDWGSTENNRRARYYSLTRAGRKALGEEVEKWNRFAATMHLILGS